MSKLVLIILVTVLIISLVACASMREDVEAEVSDKGLLCYFSICIVILAFFLALTGTGPDRPIAGAKDKRTKRVVDLEVVCTDADNMHITKED